MGMQIKIVGDREVDGLLHPLVFRRLSRQMKFADAAIITAFEFVLHQIKDDGIAEPAADVRADTVWPDKRHDLQTIRLRIDKRMGAGVGAAGRENAGHAMLPEQRQHLVEPVVWLRLPIVMQMRVEDFDGLGREDAIIRRGEHRDGDHDCDTSRSKPHRPCRRHHSAATTCGRSASSASPACGSRRRFRRRSIRSR